MRYTRQQLHCMVDEAVDRREWNEKTFRPEAEREAMYAERRRLSAELPHPLQPLYKDECGTARFKENAIVRFLLDEGLFDLNCLAMQGFTKEDETQFAQLIGYSLSGFHELDYVSDEAAEAATREAQKLDPEFGGCRDHGCTVHRHDTERQEK